MRILRFRFDFDFIPWQRRASIVLLLGHVVTEDVVHQIFWPLMVEMLKSILRNTDIKSDLKRYKV